MEWSTLISTLTGAAIAMGTSLMVEIRRDRRDTEAEWRRIRREIYTEFLTVMNETYWALAIIADDDELSSIERRRRVNEIFARCLQLRHQLELYAPAKVVEPALVYFRIVREVRDAVRGGQRDDIFTSETDSPYRPRARKAAGHCRDAMRADINANAQPLDYEDPARPAQSTPLRPRSDLEGHVPGQDTGRSSP